MFETLEQYIDEKRGKVNNRGGLILSENLLIKKYEIPTENNIKKAIEVGLRKIKTAESSSQEAGFVRDMWLFSLYCNGMNMANIFTLNSTFRL